MTLAEREQVDLAPRCPTALTGSRISGSVGRRDRPVADGGDRQHARTRGDTVQMNGASAALLNAKGFDRPLTQPAL
jgi:hypothetical protein